MIPLPFIESYIYFYYLLYNGDTNRGQEIYTPKRYFI